MAGFLIQQGATVMCIHGGQGMPMVPNPSLTLGGAPSCVIADPWTVAGCPGIPSSVPPCITAQWVVGTTRVTSNGQPLVVQSGQAICAPPGTPLLPLATQTRVSAI